MNKRQFRIFQLVALSLVLIAFYCSTKASEDVIRSVELKLLWEKKVDFEYDMIHLDPFFDRICIERQSDWQRKSYTFYNSLGEKRFRVEESKYGQKVGRKNIYEHPDYVRAKKSGTLSELNLVIDDFVAKSYNNKYLGVFQTFFNNKDNRFCRRFLFYEIDLDCNRNLLWEKDTICFEERYCLNVCFIADNGNVMLSAGNPRYDQVKKLLVYTKSGILLHDVDNCSEAPVWGVAMNRMGQFKYEKWSFESWPKVNIDLKYFNQEGEEIRKEEFQNPLFLDPFDISTLPFYKPLEKGEILNYKFFSDKKGLNIVYIKAKQKYGTQLSLYNIEKGEEIWTIDNKKDGYGFCRLTISQNGDIIVTTLEMDLNIEDHKKCSLENPVEIIFLNKKGEVVYSFESQNKYGYLKISADGKKLFLVDDVGNMKMYSIKISR